MRQNSVPAHAGAWFARHRIAAPTIPWRALAEPPAPPRFSSFAFEFFRLELRGAGLWRQRLVRALACGRG